MRVRLWIDDLRSPPDKSWKWAKTSEEAIHAINVGIYSGMTYREISFDHDLGEKDDAYSVATFIESHAYKGYLSRIKWHIHTANPVGRLRIQAAMMSADKYWDRNEEREKTDPFWYEKNGEVR